jgi:YfiH family protein
MNGPPAHPQDPDPRWIVPAWPVPPTVRALVTTRAGGVSQGPWGAVSGGGLNLGDGSDDPAAIAANRGRLRACLPAEPAWLDQVHGTEIVDAENAPERTRADGAYATRAGVVCCVRAADCLPVLLADAAGRGVAAAHAGWRGLAAGIIQNAAHALRAAMNDPAAPLLAYLGPAIGPAHFVVGSEVLAAMRQRLPAAAEAFTAHGPEKFRADLFALARQALAQCGVEQVFGGGLCTFSDPARFYSYRRESPTGRQAALIWRNE